MAARASAQRGSTKRDRGTIDRLPSGAYRVRVFAGRDPISGKRYDVTEVIPAGPDAARIAKKALTRIVHQIDERRHPKTNATVNQLLDRYLDLLTVGRTTLARYRQLADLHVRPLIGSEKAGRIDGEIIDSLYAELRRCQVHCTKKKGVVDHRTTRPHKCDARCGPHQCKPLAEGTVRKVHYLLSGAFKKAVYWNWLTVSPIDQTEPPPPAPANPQPPSAAEAAAILNRAWRNDVDWGTQVWLSMVTGSRRGEICGIRWRHVDLENSVLHMEKAIGQDGTETWEKDTKTHQDRRIVIDPATVELLSEHWERCATRARSLGLTLPKDAFVFSTKPDGSASLRPSSVTQRYRRLVQSLNIDSTLHALRHYSATELIGAGVDIRTVAGRLGHGGGGSTTLRVYAAWLAEADQRASQALMARVPERPTPLPDPIERAKTDPEAPYERIAAQVRNEILAGDHRPGDPAPTLKALQVAHGVGAGTAHRALGLLKAWGLVDGSRGQRAVFVAPQDVEPDADSPQDVETADQPTSTPADPAPTSPSALDLRLLCLGKPVRDFTTKADPDDVDHLHRLLVNAARRHAGTDGQLEDYELEVRRRGESAVLATYAAL